MATQGIEITEVSVYPVKNKMEGSYVEAFSRVTLNDQLIINGIRVIKGKKGPFLGFPQEYNKQESRGFDICYPISLQLRQYMTEKVLEAYSKIEGNYRED